MDGAYQLIENTGLYKVHFKAEKNNIDPESMYFWDIKTNNQILSLGDPCHRTEYRIKITYKKYCYNGSVYNGDISVIDTYSNDNPNYFHQQITFSDYSYSTNDTGFSMNGTLTATKDESNTTVELDLIVTDSVTLVQQWIRDGLVQIEDREGALYYTLSGQYYNSPLGYVDITTDEPIIFNDLEEEIPSDGVFIIDGKNGSKAKLTIYSIINYRVSNDADGDGNFEYKSEMFFNENPDVVPEDYLSSMKDGRMAYFLFGGTWPRLLMFDMDLKRFYYCEKTRCQTLNISI